MMGNLMPIMVQVGESRLRRWRSVCIENIYSNFLWQVCVKWKAPGIWTCKDSAKTLAKTLEFGHAKTLSKPEVPTSYAASALTVRTQEHHPKVE